MILALACQNLLAGSIGGGENILGKVEEPPPRLRILCKCSVNICKCGAGEQSEQGGSPKGRFYAAKSFEIGEQE